jgi:photosystem I P700 chlorophyll a apoprotein A2
MLGSAHLQLSLALFTLGILSSVTAQHLYSLAPYSYLAYDYPTTVALYTHHSWISSALIIGSFAHGGIFLIRDYSQVPNDIFTTLLAHKAILVSHLSYISLFLGAHTLGIYVHNDTTQAFNDPCNQLLIEPVFAQLLQDTSHVMPISPGDFLVHHAIALGLHVTTLILFKGNLDARGSKLMPDKVSFTFSFACDGPGRGGTCDISAYDSFYLATFWALNLNAWFLFYFL